MRGARNDDYCNGYRGVRAAVRTTGPTLQATRLRSDPLKPAPKLPPAITVPAKKVTPGWLVTPASVTARPSRVRRGGCARTNNRGDKALPR